MVCVQSVRVEFMAIFVYKDLRKTASVSDLILIITVIILIIIGFVRLYQNKNEKSVYVYKDSVLIGSYPLSKDLKIEIDEHNSVLIKGKKVRMLYADCPDKRCLRQGDSNMLPIICMPNRVMIEIKSRHKEKSKFILY